MDRCSKILPSQLWPPCYHSYQPPGAPTESMAHNILASLLCPMYGITTATGAILSGSMFTKKKLVRAQRARALCMLVPWELNKKYGYAATNLDLACGDKKLRFTDIGSDMTVDHRSGGMATRPYTGNFHSKVRRLLDDCGYFWGFPLRALSHSRQRTGERESDMGW
jgi:hypothetical protein